MFMTPLLISFACIQQNSSSENTPLSFVSLHPSITETLFALKAEGSLKGRSDYCSVPSKFEHLPTLGTAITPNIELIAQLQVSTIFGDASLAQHEGALSNIATVEALPWLSIDDMKTSVRRLGELTNTINQAAIIVDSISTAFDTTAELHPEPVLLLLGGSEIQKGQLWFIKPESIHGSILEASGFSNAVPTGSSIPQMSIENLLEINPPIIALFGDNKDNLTDLQSKQSQLMELTSLKAVTNKHVCILQVSNAFGTGPSILNTTAQIRTQMTECLR
jgi:iron complex transport system substrate-binding protein